jgi:hypothetical protein
MKLNQLFYEIPSIETLSQLLKCFGLRSLHDSREFCKTDLVELKTVSELVEIIPELALFYLPCKANIYLNDITEKRAVTILSQNLKLFEYRLLRDERIVNQKKVIYYKLQKMEDTKIQISNNNVEVDFN